jgi:hypothetical protein
VLPPDVLQLAAAHRLRQQRLAALAAHELGKVWSAVDSSDVEGSWARLAPRALALMAAAQIEAARGAQDYVAAAVVLQDAVPDPAGTVPPAAFAGVASDGRPLESLLGYPAFEVGAFIRQGMSTAEALGVGARHMTRIVGTQIQDTARISTGVATVNDRTVVGYIRVTGGSCCSRCAILAGRWYAYRANFLRHPLCDCTQAPATGETKPQSPKAIFDAMSPAERRKAGWSLADQRAIADGADLYQVTNAHRDLRSVQVAGRTVKTTLQGGTRRGIAGKRLSATKGARAIRLTPESIYAEADRLGWSRDETIRQLQRHGYIVGDTRPVAAAITRPVPRVAAAAPAPSYGAKVAAAAQGRAALAAANAALGRTTAGMVKLSRGEAAALRDYVSSGFYAINGQLRRDAVDSLEQVGIDRIDAVMAQAALDRDVATWRGIANADKLFGDRLAGDLTGFGWTEKAYTSTSASRDVAGAFTYQSGQVLMRVLVPGGVGAVRLSGLELGGQAELLLQRGLRFRVVADRGISPEGYRLLDIEVVR